MMNDEECLCQDLTSSSPPRTNSSSNRPFEVIVEEILSDVGTSFTVTLPTETPPPAQQSDGFTPMEDLNLLSYILAFVGKNDYRLVASVNHNFQAVYVKLFPNNKQTYCYLCYASTVHHAAMCYYEYVFQTGDVQNQ
jgi:hypothetical protein